MSTIRIEGADKLIEKLKSLESMARVKQAIKDAAVELKGYIQEAPHHVPRPNPLIKLDDRVRRGFFAALKSGKIEVPYRRGASPGSEMLSKKGWTISTANQGWRAVVGTSVSYARLVQDSAKQTSYHRQTGWLTTRQAVMLYGKEATDMIQTALRNEVNA